MFEVSVKTLKGMHVSKLRCNEERCSIGKGRENNITLHGWKVSRRHAEFVRRQDGIHITELEDGGPVLVNGNKVSRYGPVCAADIVQIGDYQLSVHTLDATPGFSEVAAREARLLGAAGLEKTVVTQTAESKSVSMEVLAAKKISDIADAKNSQKDLENRWRSNIHRQLFDLIDLRRVNVSSMSDYELREFTAQAITEIMSIVEDFAAKLNKLQIAADVLAEAVGLGPLEALLAREDVSEIMVNSADQIFFESNGRIQQSEITFTNDQSVLRAIERIVAPLGRRIDESSPMVDARLRDGSRVNAVIPPLALKGPCITIRKFMQERLTADHLIKFGSLNQAMVSFLQMVVMQKRNVVISGGTGSGKTTLLNVLSGFIPDSERIVTVEDAAELKLYQPNLVSLEARPGNQEGKGIVSIRDLVKNCLRMRPDRIVVGECRGGEALDMLQAMNTGHDGSLTTVHANSPRDCIARLEVLVLMSGMDLPISAIREQIASAVNVIVQQTRFACGSRRVTSISELTGIETGTVQLAEIFKFQQTGFDEHGKVMGSFIATGLIPEFYEGLISRGIDVDISIFHAGRELE
ncbi:MAG: cpaF [Verrucomicrobiaceae bacterium]|nr:cpaF [Verrucomicrobiaceae bacterium]